MDDYVELNVFVKLKLLLPTGGQAKLLIRDGKVIVNGVVETRNKRKLHKGDKVRVEGKAWVV
jgi:ribosome-associated protein